jgi:hypothetical protein
MLATISCNQHQMRMNDGDVVNMLLTVERTDNNIRSLHQPEEETMAVAKKKTAAKKPAAKKTVKKAVKKVAKKK